MALGALSSNFTVNGSITVTALMPAVDRLVPSGDRGVVSTPPTALTIAGSDSGGGAGVQADLKTFAAFGVHGTSAVTALTAQNTVEVAGVHVAPPGFVDQQITMVLTDFVVVAVKTGMLATAEIISVVAARAARGELANLVVDPVMVATSGDRLLEPDAERAYVEELFPHAAVITPNVVEASVLVGRTVRTVDDQIEAACRLYEFGPDCVVVTGGDIDGDDVVDVVFDGTSPRLLRSVRISTGNTHGTGCTFSAAIAARLAAGATTAQAIDSAKRYVTTALQGAADWRLGRGHGPVDHLGLQHRGRRD